MYPYLAGSHAPAGREREPIQLPVEGELPEGLAGTFARNSADPVHGPGPRYHWFDGDGLVHAVEVRDGRAVYRSRWVRTEGFLAEQQAGRPLWDGLHDARGPLKDTANTDLVVFDRQLLATWWLTGTPMALDLPSLSTRGPGRAGGAALPPLAAHAKTDPRTGELVFMGFDQLRRPFVHAGTASPDGTIRRVPVDVPHAHVPHDIGFTDRFLVLMDLPLGWTARGDGRRRLAFFRDRPARFGLLPRSGEPAVRWFETDPFYLYHLSGAWEEGDEVVVVGCRIADPIPERPTPDDRIARLDTIELVPHLHRWRLDLRTGAVRSEALDDAPTEFPRADDRAWGRKPRRVYHPRLGRGPALTFDAVIRYDLDLGSSQTHVWGSGRTSGEVVFAPRAGGVEDDDGWLVTILNEPDGTSSFVGLCARTLEPRFRAPLPFHVPQGFHAAWIPEGAVGAGA